MSTSTADTPTTAAVLAFNVRRLREANGWTQSVLAAHLGLPRQRVSEIERACFDAGVSIIGRLARVFGVSQAELLDSRHFPLS